MPAIELHPAIRNLPELYTMIRSTPPASSHFADIPVPAPAPMIGRPAAILAANRSKMFDRVCIIADFSLSRIKRPRHDQTATRSDCVRRSHARPRLYRTLRMSKGRAGWSREILIWLKASGANGQ